MTILSTVPTLVCHQSTAVLRVRDSTFKSGSPTVCALGILRRVQHWQRLEFEIVRAAMSLPS